ncbi:MAG: type I DNA topoisomerase [Holosporales bacterium]|jgi:DNA topoisomerase-1|nr:type I DNA topoisomerase [Holosporales bacterium]
MKSNANTVVIVESPAKASTIEKYLGPGYSVLASYGHVRDLLNKSGSVDPDHDFAMVWASTDRSEKHIANILKAAKGSQMLLLATDPDREGEAIAWHISQLIAQAYQGNTPPMRRVVFHEITKNAVLSAIADPHELNDLLVNAYLARRALDYLVGYSLSPILWQKLPGARSAGRVQSVALRLIVDREEDIEKFKSEEYWTINGLFATEANETFIAKLSVYDANKLGKMSISTQEQSAQICAKLSTLNYAVSNVEKKQIHRNPSPPFTTSTLQQEASRKLGFGASRTMRTAQKLYEGVSINGELTGLITYMRTDSVNLSQEAVADMRKFISSVYGANYLPKEKRTYKTRAKNAQEAHEAIRPTSVSRRPDEVAAFLDADQRALYSLIWKRAIASQMESAVFDQVVVEIAGTSRTEPLGANMFKAVGTTQIFDGFRKVYQEGRDDADAEDDTASIPVVKSGDALALKNTTPDQHFTQPPPRYTEATLVKHLEELGIGRPSTYAPLMQVLQDREYAVIEKRQFVPSSRGRIVTAFLTNFCAKYVEYDFTAHLEDELDDIASGELNWKNVMHNFWADFSDAVHHMQEIRITEVIDKLEQNLETYLFKDDSARACPKCEGRMGLKLSKFGAFLGCSNYPECQNRVPLSGSQEQSQQNFVDAVVLGTDPEDGSTLSLKHGPYGYYIQVDSQGEEHAKDAPGSQTQGSQTQESQTQESQTHNTQGYNTQESHPSDPASVPATALDSAQDAPKGKTKGRASAKKEPSTKRASKAKAPPKPKRVGLPPAMNPQTVTLEVALQLKALPKVIGSREGNAIVVNTGRFGPYVKCDAVVASIPKRLDFLNLSEQDAIELIDNKIKKQSSRVTTGSPTGSTSNTTSTRKTAKSAPGEKGTTTKTKAASSKAKTSKTSTATSKAKTASAKSKTAITKKKATRAKTGSRKITTKENP